MADMRVTVDDAAVKRAIDGSDGVKPLLLKRGNEIASRANALGAGYRTPKWHDRKTGETKGGKAPQYGATLGSSRTMCIVHPENYSAMKDNYLHNTMLKAKG